MSINPLSHHLDAVRAVNLNALHALNLGVLSTVGYM